MLNLTHIPNFCAHEHWGSLDAIGGFDGGFHVDRFPGALPQRRVTLLDLILDPYMNGWLAAQGTQPFRFLQEAFGVKDIWRMAAEEPGRVLRALRPLLEPSRLTGVYQCIRRGIALAHECDIADGNEEAVREANTRIGDRYENIHGWYQELMTQCGFTGALAALHPEYYLSKRPEDSAVVFYPTHSVMRIDPLLGFWKKDCPRRDELADALGVEPRDAASWEDFLDRLFECAHAGGAKGIKQLQAYRRSLEYEPRQDSAVRFHGELQPHEVRVFEDWLVHACCARADDYSWVQQVHVGTHNLPDSAPLPLCGLASRYPRQRLILLHCWPFPDECAYMAKQLPNVYLDACWQCILAPGILRRSLQHWLDYVPSNKLLLSHDATSIEMAAGSASFTRAILAEELQTALDREHATEQQLLRAARALLHDNALRVHAIELCDAD